MIAHADDERDVQEQREADGAAEEFGEVGRHRRHFADDPQGPDRSRRKMLAAQFGEIAPGDDAELGRQRLEQHGGDIGRQHHPQERIAVFRPGLDVGGEIAGVYIGDRGDHRGAGEQERASPAPSACQDVAYARDRPVRHGQTRGRVPVCAHNRVAHRLWPPGFLASHP